MTELVTNLFNQANQIAGRYLEGILNGVYNFFNGNYAILALVLLLFGIIFIIGLFRWLSRSAKSFLFFMILFGVVGAVWWFFGRTVAELPLFIF